MGPKSAILNGGGDFSPCDPKAEDTCDRHKQINAETQ